jgi:hypothetical protein
MVEVEFGEFKGNKIIILKRNPEDTFPFQFGLGKAKLILGAVEEIQKFVDENESPIVEKDEA